MEHVFVETNWLVAYSAPAHHQVYAATELLKKAERGEILLYLPAICLSECRRPIREKFQVRLEADRIRKFLLWAKENQIIDLATDETVRRTLDVMEARVKTHLDGLDDLINRIRKRQGLEVFHFDEEMAERSTELSTLGLQPFDQAILSSILVRAERLKNSGANRFAFCELDSDLQPWDRDGNPKEPLVSMYKQAAIWVYRDFLLERPEMPESWPNS